MQRPLLAIFWFVCATALMPAHAQQPVPVESVRAFVQNELGPLEGASRVEITVGQTDARLQLAACGRAEPFLRNGARLWGRTFVGLRCVSGAQWTINVPVQVRVYGPGLVAARMLAAGQPISDSDVRSEELEWTRQPQGVAHDASDLQGRVPTRAIEQGQPIGLALLAEAPAVTQGDSVKLVGRGSGFSITTDAVALASAVPGQPVRVRVESGRILTGTAREGRIVEVSF
jgi:flagella basal body P-ring formation protein FlgA